MSQWAKVESLLQETRESRISRRVLLERAAALGLATSAVGPLLSACASNGSAAANAITLRFGYTATPTNPVAIGCEKFASLVNTRSNKAIHIQTFGSSQLGSDRELVQSAQSGALDIGDSSNNNLDQFTSKMEVLELPYLIQSRQAYRTFWTGPLSNSIRQDFESKLGLKILMALDAAGFRSIETKSAEVHTPADVHGLKLRVAPTPIEEATFRLWGANPVAMAYNQVFTALQQDTISGEVLQPVWFYSDKHYEAATKICDIHYIMLSHIVVMNLKKFSSLPADHQSLLLSAAKDAEDYEWQVAGTMSDQAITKLKAMSNIQYYTPPADVLQQWQESSRPVWDQFADQIGRDLINQVAALK